jgi:hypothetical protein
MSLKGWTAVLETNLTGPFLMSTTGLLTQGVPEVPRDPIDDPLDPLQIGKDLVPQETRPH